MRFKVVNNPLGPEQVISMQFEVSCYKQNINRNQKLISQF